MVVGLSLNTNMPTLHKATVLRISLRHYVDLLTTHTSLSKYTDHKFTRYVAIHYHGLLYPIRAGIYGAWFISNAHERQKQHLHAIFDMSCVVFDSTYEYKSAMHRCVDKEYMI